MSPDNGNPDLVPLEPAKSISDINSAEGNKIATGAGDLIFERNPASVLLLGMLGLGPASKKVEAKPKIILKIPTKKLPKGEELSLLRVIPRDCAMRAIYSLRGVLEASGGWTTHFFTIVATAVFGLPAFMGLFLQAKLVEIYGNCTLSFLNDYLDNHVVGRSVAALLFKLVAVENGTTITIGDLVRLLVTINQHHSGVFKNAVDGDLDMQRYFEICAGRILFELTQGGAKPANFAQFKKCPRVLDKFKLFDSLTEVDVYSDPHFFSPQGAVLTLNTFESLSKDGLSVLKEDLSAYNNGALPGMVLDRMASTKIFKDSGCELPAISLAEFAGLHKALADKESFASRNYWWRLLGLGEDHALAAATLRTLYDGTVKAVLGKYQFADEDAPMTSQQYVGMAGDLLRLPDQPCGVSSFQIKNFISEVNARHVGAFIGQLTDVHYFFEQSCNSSDHRRRLKSGSCTAWEKLIIENFKGGDQEDKKGGDGDVEEGGCIIEQQQEEVDDQQGVQEGGNAVETETLQAVEEGVGMVAEAADAAVEAEVGMGKQTIPVPFYAVPVAPQPVLSYQGEDGSIVYIYEGEPAHLMWLEHQQLQQYEYEQELARRRLEEEELVRRSQWEKERAWRQQQEYKDSIRREQRQQQQQQQQQQWGAPHRCQQRAASRPQQQRRRLHPSQNRNKQHHHQQRRHHQQQPQFLHGWEQQQQQQFQHQQYWPQGPHAAFHHHTPMPSPFYRPSF